MDLESGLLSYRFFRRARFRFALCVTVLKAIKLTSMEFTQTFGDRLAANVLAKKSAVCVGLDPRWQNLPKAITDGIDRNDRQRIAQATSCYCREVIDAVASHAPVVKPQAAFFEQLGPHGMYALGEIVAYARKSGLLVLLDGKRGDIGTTAAGYADAYLGAESAWQCDALTVNPFLGDDTLVPFFETAEARNAGVFVLVKTSNPGSGFIQDQIIDGKTIYQQIANVVQAAASSQVGSSGYGNIGAVVGATYPQQLADLRAAMPNVWILIPGYGAQGGTANDVQHGFDRQAGGGVGLGAIVNSSRGIIFAYERDEYQGLNWQEAISQATIEMAASVGYQ